MVGRLAAVENKYGGSFIHLVCQRVVYASYFVQENLPGDNRSERIKRVNGRKAEEFLTDGTWSFC